ncbi:MAG: hypothetical protein AB7V08_08480 [Elusimicrobiales bacterium]
MKKLLLIALLLAPASAKAGGLDAMLSDTWRAVSASSNFHLLDNASMEIGKDLNRHAFYAVSSTYLYKYKYVSADFLGIKPLESSASLIPGAGIKFHAGELLYTIPAVKAAADSIGKSAKLIDSATLAAGYSRDFTHGRDIVMIYGGFVKKF